MIKKFHYIKEDYSGNAEKICLKLYKKIYPDFEFMAWKPGSSPWKILYDNGGLFIGPGIFPVKRIPDSFLEKTFFVFSNVFDSFEISRNILYSDKKEDPILFELMKDGSYESVKKRVLQNANKIGLNEKDFFFDEYNVYNKNQFGFLDRLSKEVPVNNEVYFIDSNTKKYNKFSDYVVHYKFIDNKIDTNKFFTICENFTNLKCEDEVKHFLFLIYSYDDYNEDLLNRMSEFLNYHCSTKMKIWDLIMSPSKSDTEELATEYLARNFNNTISCEKV